MIPLLFLVKSYFGLPFGSHFFCHYICASQLKLGAYCPLPTAQSLAPAAQSLAPAAQGFVPAARCPLPGLVDPDAYSSCLSD